MDQGVSIDSEEETPDAKSKGKGKAKEVIAEASTKDEEFQEDGKEKDKLQVSKKKAARRVVDDEAPPRHSSRDWDMSDLHNAVDFPTQDPLTETDGPSLMDITDGEVHTTDDDGLLTSELGKDINFEARLLLNVLPRSLVQRHFDGRLQQ